MTTQHKPLTTLLLSFSVAVFAQACSAGWQVLRTGGNPSPVQNVKELAIQFDYSVLRVEGYSEEEWLEKKSAKDSDYRKTWGSLISTFEENFINGFQGGPAHVRHLPPGQAPQPNEAVLIVKMRNLKMGTYMGIMATKTVVDSSLEWIIDGAPSDKILIRGASEHSAFKPSVFNNIPPVAKYIGNRGKAYMASLGTKS